MCTIFCSLLEALLIRVMYYFYRSTNRLYSFGIYNNNSMEMCTGMHVLLCICFGYETFKCPRITKLLGQGQGHFGKMGCSNCWKQNYFAVTKLL